MKNRIKHDLNLVDNRIWRPKSLQKVIDIAESNLNYEKHTGDMSSFQVDEAGRLIGDGLELRFTEKGFVQLCKFLKIPNPFANFITWDLLRDNINRISRGIIDKEVALYFYENDKGENICVNATTTRKVGLPHELFLQGLVDLDYDIDRIRLEDNFLDLYICNPEDGHIPPKEIKKGDKIKSGIRFRNSTSGYCYPEYRNMYWRLVCSNGMVMPVSEGQHRLKIKNDSDPTPKVEAFLVSMNAAISELTHFPDFEEMMNKTLDTVEFSRWWKSLKRTIDDTDYVDDHIFQIDADLRKNWISQSRLVAKEEAEPEMTSVNAWDLLNNVTEKAQTFNPELNSKLDELAGKMLVKLD